MENSNYMNAKMPSMHIYCFADGNLREAHYPHQEQSLTTFLERSMYARIHEHLRGSGVRP
jgi:hypothetical protein